MAAVGYIEPWSVRGGEDASVYISCVDPRATIAIVCLDRDLPETFDWIIQRSTEKLRVREYELGSWIELPAGLFPISCKSWALTAEFLLTKNLIEKPISCVGMATIFVTPKGELTFQTKTSCERFGFLRNEQWYELRWDFGEINASLSVVDEKSRLVAQTEFQRSEIFGAHLLALGSSGDPGAKTLNGRFGRISIVQDGTSYSWQFPAVGPRLCLRSIEDAEVLLSIHNMPTFAVASSRFTGESHDPRMVPSHYDAVHIHDDDFGGFDWPHDMVVSVPPNARSGVYAAEITSAAGVEKLPFFVCSASPASKLAFLVPTFTYLSYADERLPPIRYPWHGSDRGHLFSIDNEFLSLYDVHSDLSGVSLTSTRRPKATLRDDYHYPLSDSPHLLPVDLQFLKFCARQGIEVDIVTDHDLHRRGSSSIAAYGGLLTGSHPEYWSRPMMAALDEFMTSGGNVAYLGGNGFYWVVALESELSS